MIEDWKRDIEKRITSLEVWRGWILGATAMGAFIGGVLTKPIAAFIGTHL